MGCFGPQGFLDLDPKVNPLDRGGLTSMLCGYIDSILGFSKGMDLLLVALRHSREFCCHNMLGIRFLSFHLIVLRVGLH